MTPYEYTEIDVVYASNVLDDRAKFAVGIINWVAGEPFGYYAGCGIVHAEPKRDGGRVADV